jgi:hypothetical protein
MVVLERETQRKGERERERERVFSFHLYGILDKCVVYICVYMDMDITNFNRNCNV